jgi:hypothetical protein
MFTHSLSWRLCWCGSGHKDEWRQWRIQGVLTHMGVAGGDAKKLLMGGLPSKAPLTAEDSFQLVTSCLALACCR